jgi:hypothetical protein
MTLAFFVSGHGFGHISRSLVIIQELLKHSTSMHLFTSRLEFLDGFTHPNLKVYKMATDVGIIQNNSIDLDLEKTKQTLKQFENNKENLKTKINSYLLDISPDLVVSDSSSLPLAVSKSLKIPCFFMGNFTWDFIYNHYSPRDPYFGEYAKELESEYNLCDRGFILPFHCPTDSIPVCEYTGLVGRKPNRSREEVRSQLGFESSKKYILFSFGAYGLDPSLFQFENKDQTYEVVISGLVGFDTSFVLQIPNIYYPDLLTACDAVLTKPGYGILSEAYFANTPILYTDRGDFIEYTYLVESMRKYHHSEYLSHSDLYSLNLYTFMEKLEVRKSKPKDTIEDGTKDLVKRFLYP